MARLALAIAYDGTRFESYARQPGHRTVEGELVSLLRGAGAFQEAKAARFRSGSRTDAGVSAAWNVVAFDSDIPAGAAVAATTKAPEGLFLLSATTVPDDFEPRHARRRLYRYLLTHAWSANRVRPALDLFRGEHDFTNFRRADADKSPRARITRLRYGARPTPFLEVEAPFFLWQQVRRIVAAIDGLERGERTLAELRSALTEPERRVDLGIAAPEGLLLLRVDYDGVAFPPPKGVALDRLDRELDATRRRLSLAEAARSGPARRRSWKR